jgi:hypothetical protein
LLPKGQALSEGGEREDMILSACNRRWIREGSQSSEKIFIETVVREESDAGKGSNLTLSVTTQ